MTSVSYVDTDGATQTLARNLYQVAGGGLSPGRIVPAYGARWPSTCNQPEAVTVRFVAGFGDSPSHVPQAIRQQIMLRVGDAYPHRENMPPDVRFDDIGAASDIMRYRGCGRF